VPSSDSPNEQPANTLGDTQSQAKVSDVNLDESKSSMLPGDSAIQTQSSQPQSQQQPVQPPQAQQQQTWRLFGPHINSFVVYADATTAWLLTDDLYGKISSTLYQRITSGQNMGGVRLTRGWTDKSSVTKEKLAASGSGSRPGTPTLNISKGKKHQDPTKSSPAENKQTDSQAETNLESAGRIALERKMSDLLGIAGDHDDPEKVMEEEMKDDYKDSDENEHDREVDHLYVRTQIRCVQSNNMLITVKDIGNTWYWSTLELADGVCQFYSRYTRLLLSIFLKKI